MWSPTPHTADGWDKLLLSSLSSCHTQASAPIHCVSRKIREAFLLRFTKYIDRLDWVKKFYWHVHSPRYLYSISYHKKSHRAVSANINITLESSQSPHTSAKAMLFSRWQHHLCFCSGFPYAPLRAMVTKISKWSRIQDSFRITPKIESLVVFAIPDMPSKFQKDPSITFWVILLTHRQTDKNQQKHNLLSGGKNYITCM